MLISINASWNIVNFRSGLIRGLQEAGYRVAALAPPDACSARLEAMGVDYRPIAIDRQGISPARDLMLLWRYWRALRRLRPDIFLGFTAKPNIYGSLAARALGVPVINNISGLGTAFIRTGVLRRIVSLLYRLALRRSATVFFQNGEDRDLLVREGMVRAEQSKLLPGSGIDLEAFRPADRRPRAGAGFTFLLVARLVWDKGVGEYVEAARRLRRDFPDARFQLLGFLDVPNRTAVSSRDVHAWVEEGIIDYLGETDDVRPYIADADCVVLPSYREGLPRTLLEAAAMARPLIATDVPGCRHLVEEGVNGFLCAVRDPASLAEAMARMIGLGDEARARLGAAGRARVEREFDERIVVGRYLAAVAAALPEPGLESGP